MAVNDCYGGAVHVYAVCTAESSTSTDKNIGISMLMKSMLMMTWNRKTFLDTLCPKTDMLWYYILS